MSIRNPLPPLLYLVIVLLATAEPTRANERRFAYAYESSVLPYGVREIEAWNTYRSGKEEFFRALDQRVEYEFGVGRNFMSSLYFNLSSSMTASGQGGIGEQVSQVSFSNEWKWKLLDRMADPVGAALYGEATLGLSEREIETKLILDKQAGGLLVAFNGVYAHEWETVIAHGAASDEGEDEIEAVFGATYFLTGRLTAGIEGSVSSMLNDGVMSHAALFLGPVLSYTSESWWATISWNPQVHNLKGTGAFDLEEYQRTAFRVLLSFAL